MVSLSLLSLSSSLELLSLSSKSLESSPAIELVLVAAVSAEATGLLSKTDAREIDDDELWLLPSMRDLFAACRIVCTG